MKNFRQVVSFEVSFCRGHTDRQTKANYIQLLTSSWYNTKKFHNLLKLQATLWHCLGKRRFVVTLVSNHPVSCYSPSSPLLVTIQSLISHHPVPCQPSHCPQLVTTRALVSHHPVSCQSSSCPLLVIIQSLVSHHPAPCQSPSS